MFSNIKFFTLHLKVKYINFKGGTYVFDKKETTR